MNDRERYISYNEAVHVNKDQVFWMSLDNAAKIYPAVQNEELTAVFRLSCVLKERLRIKPLLSAIQKIERRFPYYKVKPRKGFFWYYLESNDERIPLVPDLTVPCRSFAKGQLIFRVLAKGKRLSVEFSHILTDATGAMEFLKTLLFAYFESNNNDVQTVATLNYNDAPLAEEFEDGFSRYFQKDIPSPHKKPPSFHLPFKLKAQPRFEVLVAKLALSQVSARAKEYQTSITIYLVAVYLHALQAIYAKLSSFSKRAQRKFLRIQVPINLRRIYSSKTMRNFSLFVTPEIDLSLGTYTFEEIVKTVHHLIQLETDRKLVNKIIARNVGAERNFFLKNTPLFLKSLILYFTYSIAGTSQYSGVITNPGKVTLGAADSLIDYFVFIPPPPNKTLKVNCGVLGFNGDLVMCFGNITTSKELEKEFLSFLVKQGVNVKIINY
ncbi:MAG TPA: hypothetical protein VF141_06585 [Chryseolinea sp.]